jgi:nucleoside-diphosphate-sugar epimerase
VRVSRYVFASSCSVYGIASNDVPLDESSPVNPITEYAKSKALVEQQVARLADADFHPTFMRNATAYGYSPSLRLDLVVNNLVAWGYLTGKIAIMSDGTPWRPIVHVEDICRAVLAALQAPAEQIHNECFNVGRNSENYQVRDIAAMVKEVVPGCKIDIRNTSSSDERTYRVDFSKFAGRFPQFAPQWTLRKGIEELYRAYREVGLTLKDFESPTYFRVRWIRHLIEKQRLDADLRWVAGPSS